MNRWVVRLALLGALVCAGIEPIYGEFVYVVNNQDATVSGYAVNPATGALTAVPGSPFATVPTPRSVTVDPSGRFAYVAGTGVAEYTINSATGALMPIAGSPVAAGVDPLSVAVDPTGRFAYVADYGGNSVLAFTINPATGALTPVAGSPYAAGSQAYSVAVDPTGRFVYVANAQRQHSVRLHD